MRSRVAAARKSLRHNRAGSQTSVSRLLQSTSSYLTTHITYDCHSMPTAVTDPNGNSTATTYDSTGLFPAVVQRPTTNGVSHIDYYSYDANTGSVKWHTDENGSGAQDAAHTTSYSYDSSGRLIKVLSPPIQNGTPETDICYTDSGGPNCSAGGPPYSVYTSTLVSTGQFLPASIQAYDGLGRLMRSVDSSGAIVQTTYDALGRVYSISNPYYSTSDPTYGISYYAYDALDRKTQQTQPDGNGSTQSWTYSGTTITSNDEAGNQWQRTTDALGRLIKVLEPNGSSQSPPMETDYGYDARNNLVWITQWGGPYGSSGSLTRSFTYDSISRLLTASNPETGTVQYTYDANGNVYTKTDARGIAITYSVDALNRVLSKTYSNGDPSVTYTYDAHSSGNSGKGFRTGMSDASGSSSWTYDADGHSITQSMTIGSINKSIAQQYYLNGATSQLTYPSGSVVQYGLDSAGRNASVTDTTNSIQYAKNATYNASGQLTGLLLGYSASFAGITESNQYQARLQPSILAASAPSGTLMSLSYNYHYGSGDNGNVYGITNNKDTSRNQSFLYDTLNRLKQASGGALWGATFSYDARGNLTQTGAVAGTATNPMPMSLSVNSKNQFTLGGYGYDNAGNVLADGSNVYNCMTGSTPTTYSWNAEEEIVCATGSTYTYNGDGERVKKSNGTLYWGGSAGAALAESDFSGRIVSEYIYFNGKRIARRDFPSTIDVRFTNDSCSGCSGTPVGGGDRNFILNSISVGSTTFPYNDASINYSSNGCSSISGGALWVPCSGDVLLQTSLQSPNVSFNGWGQTDYSIYPHIQVYVNGSLSGEFNVSGSSQTYLVNPIYYFISDHLGSSNVVVNSQGTIQSESDFYPFGGERAVTQNLANQHYKFTGKERDSETGNDYFGARYDSSAVGRFLSPDWSAKAEPVPYAKLADPQSLNLYSYVENNPLRSVDPDGHVGTSREFDSLFAKGACEDPQSNVTCVIRDQWKALLQIATQMASLLIVQPNQQTSQDSEAQQQNDKNTDVMMMANSGAGPSANPHPSSHGMDGTAYMDWSIVPQADNISQLSSASIKAAQDKYSKASILLDESKPGGKEHWEGSDTGKGHDNINPMALPVTQKWYINTGGGNNSGNQRIQLVIGMKPDGTLIKAWTVQVTAGPVYKKED